MKRSRYPSLKRFSMSLLESAVKQPVDAQAASLGLIAVRGNGAQRPLFVVDDETGCNEWLCRVTQHLDPDVPVYRLLGAPSDRGQARTVESMATRLIESMRTVQPKGPYRIAGSGFAGVLAYEVAAQLVGRDQLVEFVGLLDTECPRVPAGSDDPEGPVRPLDQAMLLDLCEQLPRPLALTTSQRAALEQLRRNVVDGMDFEEVVRRCVDIDLLPSALIGCSELLRAYITRLWGCFDALAQYAVQPLPLVLNLFVPSNDARDPARTQAWAALVPSIQIWSPERGEELQAVTEASCATALADALARSVADATHRPSTLPDRRHMAPVVIQSGRQDRVPVVCVPGAGDSVINFVPLGEALGAAFPLHGLQPRGTEGLHVPHSTVEAAASFYVESIQARQPDGPVHVIGHSFGGWVALEMALQLRAHGRPVASLTVIDSEAPDSSGFLGGEYTSTAVLVHLMRLIELSAKKSLGVDVQAFRRHSRTEQTRMLHEGMVRIGLLPARSKPEMLQGLTRTFGTALRTTYRPAKTYPEPMGLVLACGSKEDGSGTSRPQSDLLQGWRRWAPELIAWQAPGDHFSVLKRPNVTALAQWWITTIATSPHELSIS